MKRETRSGKILGGDQVIDAYAALQQITTGPAYQFYEENRKGKIKKGMLADFVILDKNPLKVANVDDIKDITVIETIKEGKTVFNSPGDLSGFHLSETLTATRFEELKGYFVKNTVSFDNDYRFVVASNKESFDKYFGSGKTLSNEITSLDFDKFNIAGILVKPSDRASKIEITKYTSDGAKTIVGFKNIIGEKQTYTSGALLLFKIPKSRTSVDFVSGSTTINIPVE